MSFMYSGRDPTSAASSENNSTTLHAAVGYGTGGHGACRRVGAQVSYSAVLYYGYVGVVGLAVWGVLKYFKSAVSLAQVWCIYGTQHRI